jgi:hypothetical protein
MGLGLRSTDLNTISISQCLSLLGLFSVLFADDGHDTDVNNDLQQGKHDHGVCLHSFTILVTITLIEIPVS